MTERFLTAAARHDGAVACAQLGADTRSELARDEQKPCRVAIVAAGLERAAIVRVQVFVTNAKVDLADGESVFLGYEPRGWRVSAAGCRPQGGKPADRPFECEVQA